MCNRLKKKSWNSFAIWCLIHLLCDVMIYNFYEWNVLHFLIFLCVIRVPHPHAICNWLGDHTGVICHTWLVAWSHRCLLLPDIWLVAWSHRRYLTFDWLLWSHRRYLTIDWLRDYTGVTWHLTVCLITQVAWLHSCYLTIDWFFDHTGVTWHLTPQSGTADWN